MAQSSIEWLISEFEKQIEFRPNSELDIWFKGLFPKAKQMHKEEIENTFDYAVDSAYTVNAIHDCEKYYNEIFKEDARKQN